MRSTASVKKDRHRLARAEPGAVLRPEGRRHGRRPRADRADGRHQPAFHRRHPRRSRRRTTCWPRCSTITSIGAMRWASTPRRVFWPRVLDMNDRALRDTGDQPGRHRRGHAARRARFDITTASEVMAILCLADDLEDLRGAAGADRRRRDARGQAGHGRRTSRRPVRWRPCSRTPPSRTSCRRWRTIRC